MVFKKGDRILFNEEGKFECVCCDEEVAIFGKVNDEIPSVSYEKMFSLTNNENIDISSAYKRVKH